MRILIILAFLAVCVLADNKSYERINRSSKNLYVKEYLSCNAGKWDEWTENQIKRCRYYPDKLALRCQVKYTIQKGYVVNQNVDCPRHDSDGFQCSLPSHNKAWVKCCSVKCLI
uniref:Cnidarian restricted protein n=1 Tax=Clytia hemisphaerica TaxID=252671 RepID=A0A7M5X623_9CNID